MDIKFKVKFSTTSTYRRWATKTPPRKVILKNRDDCSNSLYNSYYSNIFKVTNTKITAKSNIVLLFYHGVAVIPPVTINNSNWDYYYNSNSTYDDYSSKYTTINYIHVLKSVKYQLQVSSSSTNR